MNRLAYIARTASTLPPDKARRLLMVALQAKSETPELKEAATAFESDMRPVCNAIVAALNADDMHALRGLRALLPHLLEEVNQSPALADVLAHQLGKSLLAGLRATPEETV